MKESEVIIVDSTPIDKYIEIIKNAVNYAIISLPFTFNRLGLTNCVFRVKNITKGKIAEGLLQFFCEENNINIDFKSCETPFWKIDNKDFILNGNEWDQKNNIYYAHPYKLKYNYTDLPALVFNKSEFDTWAKRNENVNVGNNGVTFLFTFLKGADLINGKRNREFFDVVINEDQQKFISELYLRYQGRPQKFEPFTEEWFFDELKKRGSTNFIKIYDYPDLIITGYADNEVFGKFKPIGPSINENNYIDLIEPYWYSKTKNGYINFMNGTMWIKLTNAVCPVKELKSFSSMFPNLKDNIKYGKFQQ